MGSMLGALITVVLAAFCRCTVCVFGGGGLFICVFATFDCDGSFAVILAVVLDVASDVPWPGGALNAISMYFATAFTVIGCGGGGGLKLLGCPSRLAISDDS